MKKLVFLVAMITGLSVFTSCGKDENLNYTNEGYDEISVQNYAKALETFDQALLTDEDAEMVYRGRGLAYMGVQEYEKALSSFQEALSNADMFPGELEYDINYYMAVCYFKLQDYENAIAVYDAIVDLNSKDPETYYLRGIMKLYVNNLDSAIEDFNKAVSFDNKDYDLYMDIYQAMLEHGYADEANQYLDVVMSADVDDIDPFDKGRLCYFQEDYSRACTYLETARQEDDNNDPELITFLGECYKKEANYEFAAVVYSSYLEQVQDPAIYNQLGLCYVEQGNYQSALNAFQAGIAIQENNTCMQTLKINEIVCYEYLADYSTAKEKLLEYTSLYPTDDILDKEYAFLSTR